MSEWHIWCQITSGAYEYLGAAPGETFLEACETMAQKNPTFAADFVHQKMTYNGNPLVPLDRRIDGARVQFGSGER